MPTKKRKTPTLPATVRDHLAEVLGGDPVPAGASEVRVPGLGTVTAYHAVRTGAGNAAAAAVLAADGSVTPLAEFVAGLGHDPFVPDFTHVPVRPPVPRDPVTIDPARNDWRLDRCDRHTETITVTVPPNGATPKADVYLLADTTGSMSPVLDAVKAGADAILGDPALAAFDVAWGVGNYRDFPVPTPNSYAFQHQQSPTTDHTAAGLAIGAWSADEGGDTSEGQLYALHQLATDAGIGWRADSKRIVVWFGDAPGHDPICTDLTGLASAITEASATADLVGAGITVVAVSTTTGPADALDDDPQGDAGDYTTCPGTGSPGQATRITAATPGGTHVSGIDPGSIVATLSALIAAAVKATGNVHLEATGDTAQFVGSISPAGGYGPLAGDETHVLTFEVVWVGTRACTERDQEFTGTIDVVADGVVVASKKVRVVVPKCRYHYVVEVVCGTRPPTDHDDGHDDRDGPCAVVPGRYATAVLIDNPTTCPARIEKRFAPVVLDGKTIGREPDVVPAKPFAKLELPAGHATMDDCCALDEAVGHGKGLLVGVLDIVSDRALEVRVVHTADGGRGSVGAPSITTRSVEARRAP
ncbi:hypothetical protein [Phycicoccus sonneratiae]|uniref:VWFA domain-containing protein n=1 Tax=Phycicoccus sonneratiae TaxID=2807628 RepID=A0ABS2CM64_9MICO|nr:hypothetical protein [Phycicoccus sonneraticus]MBM6400558.1 hypothetical protein [Phycicoccus sonneraticus]